MGDFDSIRTDVIRYFSNNFIEDVVTLENQDYTDLEKSLFFMKN